MPAVLAEFTLPSPHDNRPEIIDVRTCRTGREQIIASLKRAERIIGVQIGPRIAAMRAHPLATGRVHKGTCVVFGPVDTVSIRGQRGDPRRPLQMQRQ